ncbi:tenascin-N isoform X42 [Canis lupus dingo]|nr:tenascin-N isoform X36 [Canis lupus dingo]XP_048968210.1 tenascin-N isoform X37 [Canis lupus dingo]XP_048968211.1 tenascin-N isoform X38 [Canis lupus dingo]XP_048968213.1 tenascin-N isoform X40 [Canis lupus dingo]XP_048968214.1 tenascin-N isoform X41 [Canis lupus dingo]XP_048968215.1 tenascin-N isoform X42 [Canis lupus dingo]
MGLQGTFCFPLGLLLGSVLLVASAPATLEPQGCSDKEQQVTVSHTYKIDVPKSALVQVETDPQPLSDDGASLLVPGEAEEQNIIFRHNIRLQTPQKDCELAGSVQDLLARVKKLEEEMAEVKEQCNAQRCCQGAAGASPPCSGHGSLSPDTCGCICDEGWEGAACERPACPGACSGHGVCVRGVCRCHEDFTSEDCSERRCPGDCSGHGFCDTGECYCEEGFSGLDCAHVVAPQGLQLLKSTENSLLVSWEPSSEVDHYLLSYYPLGQELSGKQIQVPKEQHSYEILGLQPGTKYIVTLRNVKKEVSSSPQHLLATTDLAVLGTAWVTDETENSLDVEWENPPTEVDYYKLQYGPLTGQEVAEVTVPKSSDPKSRYDITGLQPGTEYRITVVPMKGELEGKPILLNGRTEIDSPTNVVTDRVTEDTAVVSWAPVQATIDKYVVRYTSADGDTRDMAVPKEQSSTVLTGLKPGEAYRVYVWAERGNQESKKANTDTLTEIDSPTNLATDRVTEDTATVSWDPVQAIIDKYMVRYTSADGDTREVPVGKEQRSTVLTGLRPGVEYTVQVWAQKGARESKKADTKAPTEIDSPKNLVTDRVTEDTATISWDPVQAVIDKYMVRYTSADGDTREVPVGKEQRSTVLTGLRPGVEYTVQVWAQKGARESKKADTKAPTDIDGPKNLVTNQVTENTATISWDPVQAIIDKYMVRYTSADGDTREVPVGKEQRSTVLTGLRPGVEYMVQVWAQKGARESKKADTKAPTEIDSPQNLVTNRVTEDTATISWDPVRAVIDKYMVRYTSADGDTMEVPVGKEQSSTVLTGLRPGVEYTVQVWAQKGARESKKADTKALTDIDPPKNLRPSAITQSGGVLTWTSPSAQIDGYILTYQFPDGTIKEIQLGRGDERLELQGLEQGITYPVSLIAFKGDRRSRSVSTTLSTVGARFPHPSDCSQVQQNSNVVSGLYTIYLHGDASRPLQVYCDMDTDGGGWIVFQRRNTGQLDFFKRWRTYVEGFGDPMKEFWLGLDKLHNLTTGTPTRYEVRVDLQTANESAYAVYDLFQVASSKERYRLTVGKYRGTAGDALTYHNGWKFTTFDRDNDIALSNCALTHHGGWWYKNCHLANPNGRYGETKHSEGVNWEPWKGHEFSIPYVELKIRPHGYSGEHVLDRKKRTLGENSRTF